jgi:two-component system response regulator MtrA
VVLHARELVLEGVREHREALLEQVWGYQYKADTRLVNVHVQRLRSKVERDVDDPKIVLTVRGVGYRAGETIPA